ncbi:hypothetical protein VDGL01_00234 [Verticillium dahliae]|nr:hypothetical protein VD0003_g6847 [Verticillium dahliae]
MSQSQRRQESRHRHSSTYDMGEGQEQTQNTDSLDFVQTREDEMNSIPPAQSFRSLAIRRREPYEQHQHFLDPPAPFTNPHPRAAASLTGSSDSGYGSSYPSSNGANYVPRRSAGHPSQYGIIDNVYNAPQNFDEYPPETTTYGFSSSPYERHNDTIRAGLSYPSAAIPRQTATPQVPFHSLIASRDTPPSLCACGPSCPTDACPCNLECDSHVAGPKQEENQAWYEAQAYSYPSAGGEEVPDPSSGYSQRGHASKSSKRSSHRASRSGTTKTLPKGCPSEFVVFLPSSPGSSEPYVAARAVIDPDYHGDPLLSNALLPRVGNVLVDCHEFVPFTGEPNSEDIARPLQEKVKPSGWGSFDYKAARTDGSYASLRDKFQFFEDLMLQVFIFGHGGKKDEADERAQKARDDEREARRGEKRAERERRKESDRKKKRVSTVPEETEAGPSVPRERRARSRLVNVETPELSGQNYEGPFEDETQGEEMPPYEETETRPEGRSRSHHERRSADKHGKKSLGFGLFKKHK